MIFIDHQFETLQAMIQIDQLDKVIYMKEVFMRKLLDIGCCSPDYFFSDGFIRIFLCTVWSINDPMVHHGRTTRYIYSFDFLF